MIGHDALKASVRIALLPMIAFSHTALVIGPMATIMLFVFPIAIVGYCFSLFRRKTRQNTGRASVVP